VARLVYDDQRLVLGSFWTLGECAQAPFSCIPTSSGLFLLNNPNSMMSSSCPYNQVVALVSSLTNL